MNLQTHFDLVSFHGIHSHMNEPMLKFSHQYGIIGLLMLRARMERLKCFTPKASDQMHKFGLLTPPIDLGHKLKLADSILE